MSSLVGQLPLRRTACGFEGHRSDLRARGRRHRCQPPCRVPTSHVRLSADVGLLHRCAVSCDVAAADQGRSRRCRPCPRLVTGSGSRRRAGRRAARPRRRGSAAFRRSLPPSAPAPAPSPCLLPCTTCTAMPPRERPADAACWRRSRRRSGRRAPRAPGAPCRLRRGQQRDQPGRDCRNDADLQRLSRAPAHAAARIRARARVDGTTVRTRQRITTRGGPTTPSRGKTWQ